MKLPQTAPSDFKNHSDHRQKRSQDSLTNGDEATQHEREIPLAQWRNGGLVARVETRSDRDQKQNVMPGQARAAQRGQS